MWQPASMLLSLLAVLSLLAAAGTNSLWFSVASLLLLVASGYCEWRADKARRC